VSPSVTKFIVAACALAVVALACSSRPEGEVGIEARAFVPREIVVRAGDSVTWVNDTAEIHTVTAREDSIPEGAAYFASGGAPDEAAALEDPAGGFIDPGESFVFTFEEPGAYDYFCIPHESSQMTGTVVVE
jgi:plastocyanin